MRPFDGYADQTAQCATIAGGALNLFAKDIDTYNAGIDDAERAVRHSGRERVLRRRRTSTTTTAR